MNSKSELVEPAERGNGGNDLLSAAQVSQWLGLSTQWLETARNKNYGPRAVKIGSRTVRYRRCDVADWLEQQMKKTTAAYIRRAKAEA